MPNELIKCWCIFLRRLKKTWNKEVKYEKLFFNFYPVNFLASTAQDIKNNPGSNHGNRFEQLGTILPTPNEYRTASGTPGSKYWQQKADYNITCELDEKNLKLTGSETITYFNNSPDVLRYLWFQLDENQHSTVKNANYQYSTGIPQELNAAQLKNGKRQKLIMVME